MSRKFKIEVEDHVFIAELLDDQAPKTCEAFWNTLPFEEDLVQVKWSGHVSYVLTEMELDEAECSRCYGVCPGDLLYNPHVHDAAEHPHELSIVYGPAVMSSVAGFAIMNLFGRVCSGNLDELYHLGIEISRKGVKKVKFSRIEE